MPHREKLSQFAKARLIEAYENDEDFLEIAKLLKTKRETAYTIIAYTGLTFAILSYTV